MHALHETTKIRALVCLLLSVAWHALLDMDAADAHYMPCRLTWWAVTGTLCITAARMLLPIERERQPEHKGNPGFVAAAILRYVPNELRLILPAMQTAAHTSKAVAEGCSLALVSMVAITVLFR